LSGRKRSRPETRSDNLISPITFTSQGIHPLNLYKPVSCRTAAQLTRINYSRSSCISLLSAQSETR
jgi:hypothetical protein